MERKKSSSKISNTDKKKYFFFGYEKKMNFSSHVHFEFLLSTTKNLLLVSFSIFILFVSLLLLLLFRFLGGFRCVRCSLRRCQCIGCTQWPLYMCFSVFCFPDGNSVWCAYTDGLGRSVRVYVCALRSTISMCVCVFGGWRPSGLQSHSLNVFVYSLQLLHMSAMACVRWQSYHTHTLGLVKVMKSCCCFFLALFIRSSLSHVSWCRATSFECRARSILLSLSSIRPLSLHHIEANFP